MPGWIAVVVGGTHARRTHPLEETHGARAASGLSGGLDNACLTSMVSSDNLEAQMALLVSWSGEAVGSRKRGSNNDYQAIMLTFEVLCP